MSKESIIEKDVNPREMALLHLYSLAFAVYSKIEDLDLPRSELYTTEKKLKFLLSLPGASSWNTIANAFSEINNIKNTIGRG